MALNNNLGVNNRRKSIPVKVGNIIVGGNSPIVIQSMTNTDTADIDLTSKQITQHIKKKVNKEFLLKYAKYVEETVKMKNK